MCHNYHTQAKQQTRIYFLPMKTNSAKTENRRLEILSLLAGLVTVVCVVSFFATSLLA